MIAGIVFDILIFVLILFCFALTMNGNWDDLSLELVWTLPVLSLGALVLAVFNTAYNRASGREILPALVLLVLSTIYLCFVMISVALSAGA